MRRTMLAAAAMLTLASGLTGCMTAKPQQHEALVKSAPKCEPLTFPIYFKSGSSDLTDPARQAIRMAADQSKGCRVADIQVLGLADADGGAVVSQQISEGRARTVADALAQNGFPASAIGAAAAGSAGAKTAAGAAVPARRRAEVAISFQP